MRWRLKCLALHLFGLPGGRLLHRFAQRHLTGTFLLTLNERTLNSYRWHLHHYPGGVALEIGAGTDLLVPLLLSRAGAPKVYAYDLVRLATLEQVNHVIAQLRVIEPGEWPILKNLDEDLLRLYRIDYRAPADARCTGLPEKSIDFICSTSVLEHVDVHHLPNLLRECARIASTRCIVTHNIGYVDHYAHSDGKISYFNFYRYPDWVWRLYNPSMQHQNRLRHSDFERLFKTHGWHIASHERVMATDGERLPMTPLSKQFRRYSTGDLYAHDGLFVLRVSAR